MELHSKIKYDNENITFFNPNIFTPPLYLSFEGEFLKGTPPPTPKKKI